MKLAFRRSTYAFVVGLQKLNSSMYRRAADSAFPFSTGRTQSNAGRRRSAGGGCWWRLCHWR